MPERFLREEKAMRFDSIHPYQGTLPQEHLCSLLNVTPRGYRL